MLDNELMLSKAQTFTAVAAVASTNYLDIVKLGEANEPLCLMVSVKDAVTSTGNATVAFKVETDSNINFATAKVDLLSVSAVGKATLVAGYNVIRFPLPMHLMKRYTRVLYTVATEVLNGGSFNAWIGRMPTNL